ncbi:tRNA (adenosine(37)-N6)-dimethylallyltransferase MiaA [Roseofilum capinflatum]|uniref:tRNA dimethylallyltransferase n=1 Tax=Roseofilum capinflatum BLCC-M114 TaxID=3022440 RepID=A0ABT7B3F1_9CYAN|nr:tRNA (adenosine(37)-N6)-dimethylallyltransferase MiaA [Roseofilum capinflatum]MDJ1173664.1 tRNA (adenosine(37)-N6)-dimethylallyltransferase MiaA [Roseofilum capinflatum BLCC-M114]
MKRGLIVICGPTATGKSGLAIALAKHLQTVILGADSRQIYREFDIGTAKPSPDELGQVPHYLINICNPQELFTVAEYQEQTQSLIEQFQNQGKIPLLVGGTGLYIRSIIAGMKIPRVAPQPELRSQLQALSQPQCYAMLQQVDPQATQKIHANDQVRTLRALEVYYVTGIPISEQQGENPPSYPIVQIGLDCFESEHLQDRIAQRTAKMIENGLVEEVKTLCEKYGADLPLLDTLGYREIKQYLAGEIDLATAEELTILHTRQFAKRQRTWFRANEQIQWFDSEDPELVEKAIKRINLLQ